MNEKQVNITTANTSQDTSTRNKSETEALRSKLNAISESQSVNFDKHGVNGDVTIVNQEIHSLR